jgi:hypothetical protein
LRQAIVALLDVFVCLLLCAPPHVGGALFMVEMNVLTRGWISAILVVLQRGVSPARHRIIRSGESALAVYVEAA